MHRNIEIILYNYEDVVNFVKICVSNNFDYAFILHDKDIDNEGNIIKPHYHFRVFYKDKKSVSAWAKIFNVKDNNVEILDDKIRAIRYLIHLDSPKKYQYNKEDVISNFDLSSYFLKKGDENFDIKLITDYISTTTKRLSFSDLKNFVLDNRLWASYRRNYSIIRDLLFEHNNIIDY